MPLVSCDNRGPRGWGGRNTSYGGEGMCGAGVCVVATVALLGAAFGTVMLASAPLLAQSTNDAPRVLPKLRQWSGGAGTFTLTAGSRIVINSSSSNTSSTLHGITTEIDDTADNFRTALQAVTGLELPEVLTSAAQSGDILLTLLNSRNTEIGDEGYVLAIGDHVEIGANTTTGIFYGRQTVLQIIAQSDDLRTLPRGTATDHPYKAHRSVMLDMGRKFWALDYLKDTIRRMAWHKLNVFHMHLTETEAFRLDSPDYPGLAPAGASYSESDIQELEALAKEHHVILIPEIDMPGHAATIVEYYEDNNPGKSIGFDCSEMDTDPFGIGITNWNINYANDTARQYAKDLLSEFAPWFDSNYFHIGADETSFDETCAELVAYADIHTNGHEGNVLPHFINEISSHLGTLGKELHIWNGYEEHGDRTALSTDVVVYYWTTGREGWTTANQRITGFVTDGFEVVVAQTPSANDTASLRLYLVPGHGVFPGEARLLNGTLNSSSGVRGYQISVWTEHRRTVADEHFEVLLTVPRALLAERLWNGPDSASSDLSGFLNTLAALPEPIGSPLIWAHDGIPKDGWSVHEISSTDGDNLGANVFDKRLDTVWRTGSGGYPHEIQIDLGDTYNVSAFQYVPIFRSQSGGGLSKDRALGYQFYVASNPSQWGSAVATGQFTGSEDTAPTIDTIQLTSAATGRYVRLVASSGMGNSSRAAVAEINIIGEPAVGTTTYLEIAGSSRITKAENAPGVLAGYTASDPDGSSGPFTWSLAGADAGDFTISESGQLSFQTVPDFETPADADTDNRYLLTVQASDGSKTGKLAVVVIVTDMDEPPGKPEAPTFSGETAEGLTVSWSEPENRGPPITNYDVQYREKGTGRFIDGDHQGPGLTLTLTDLEPGTDYEVQVRARNEEGTGGWSESGEGMTIAPLTLEMMTMEEPPVSKSFTVRFSFSEEVTGFSTGDIDTGQDPACMDDQNNPVFCDPGIGALETADDRVFTTTVTPGTERVAHNYTLRLTVEEDAVRSSVGSKPNEKGMLEVRVAPPGVTEPISSMGLQASAGSGSVRLNWNLPSDDGGSPIIRYEYRYAVTGEVWSEWENVAGGSRGVTVGNLVNGREYIFEVRAVNDLGKGGAETVMATPELRIAPPPPPPPPRNGGGGGLLFPPEAPAGVMAMPGDGAVRLEWSPPESDGGTPILRYEYRLKEGQGEFGEWTPIADSAPGEVNATGVTVGGLDNGTVYVFELRAVNLVGNGRVSEAVEAVMGLDRAYWSNFGGEDLQGGEASLERGPFGGGPQSLRLRFGAGLRFEESELDGEGEVAATRMGSYGYRYTSRTTGELRLDYDGGEVCELRLTFRREGAGSYSYRCGGVLGGQGSFRMSGLNRAPEITSAGPFEVAENTARVGQLEAVDPDEEDEVTGYGIAGGADGGLFAVDEETGELMFREASDYEDPSDVESAEPASGAADNEYIVVVEVRSGEGERERKGSRAIRVRVSDEEEPPEITSLGPFEVVENQTMVGQLEAVDQDKQDEITEYGIAGGADGELFEVVEETGELLFREAPDYETPGDVESAEPASGAADNEYIVVVEVRSGEGERERRGSRAIRVRVTDEEEPPEITSAGPFEVAENTARVGQLEAVDPDEEDEVTGYGIAGGADGELFEVVEETGELQFREAPDYEDPSDVESAEPASGAADNEYIVVVEVRSGEGERERRGSRAIRVRVSDEEEPPEITSLGPFEVVENRTRVGQLEAVDQDKQDEITEYGIAGGADGGLFEVEAETGELMFREAPDYEDPSDVESAEPASGAADNEYIVVVEVRSGEGERERRGSRAIRVRVSDEEEPPGAPAAPVVTAEGSDSLKVSWREPENRGPEIVDYEVRYREGGEAGYTDGGHEGRGLEVRLSGLKEGTAYEVQVRAVNEEGMSEWSEPGEGRTGMEEDDPEEPDPEDPSDFTEGDLEGRRLTLRLEGEEGTARSLELRFGEGNRFEQIESVGEQAATRTEGASRSGSYSYQRTGSRMGTLSLAYDDGSSCEVLLAFTESGAGAFSYDCGEGAPAEGSFRLTTGSLFVPVILSAAGRSNSLFTSELTLTNRGDEEVKLDYTYTAHRGGGSGKTSDVLAPGMQKIETDALTYLRGLGVPIPETGNRIGTLRVEARLGSEVEAVVRTTTVVPDGRAGLAYLGVAEEEGFEEAVYLCGLRQNSRDRSNVAFQNMGAPEEGAITIRTTVYSGESTDTNARVLEEITLEPGGFHQYSGLLGVLESVGGDRQGYVKVERVEGRAPFYAYGVINDQANSDGSFIFPVAASSLEGRMGQTLPVIVETSEFRSELTVTNFSEEPRTLDFQFVAEQVKTDDKTAAFTMTLEAGQQEIVAEVVEALRRQEVAGLGTSRGFYAGPLFAEAEGGDMSGIVIGARTGSEGGGGSYSVFYNAVPLGEAFSQEAWVEGLQQNQENRSNLALVNTGEVDGSASVFHLEIYDGETGLLAETVVTKAIPPRGWHQINGILRRSGPETRQGYIRIRKVSGENPFLAYGVVNDGGAPGERSGDGAYLPARE